jgi:hypothetical protein
MLAALVIPGIVVLIAIVLLMSGGSGRRSPTSMPSVQSLGSLPP